MEQIGEGIEKELGLIRHTTKNFKANIKMGGKRVERDNYLILYRCPDPLRYYDEEYQQSFVDQDLPPEPLVLNPEAS